MKELLRLKELLANAITNEEASTKRADFIYYRDLASDLQSEIWHLEESL